MAQASSGDEDMVTGINVTPLVDVVLVLLVIFMVTAKLIASQGIPLDLPKAASAGATQTILAVSVTREGAVGHQWLARSNRQRSRRAAQGALAQSPDLRTVIQASSGASLAP